MRLAPTGSETKPGAHALASCLATEARRRGGVQCEAHCLWRTPICMNQSPLGRQTSVLQGMRAAANGGA